MTPTTPTAAPGAAEFQKRPVNIWAIQWTGENLDAVMLFCAGNATYELMFRDNSEIVIATLEDGGDKVARHVADKGDWIIRGIKGEFYPCKPDIFEATYAAPPPPVGELQGVSDEEVESAYRLLSEVIHIDYTLAYVEAVVRRALEFFAASRPVADKDAERMRFLAQRGGMLVISDDANNSFTVEVDGGTDTEGEPIVTSYTGVTLRIAIDMAMAATKAGGAS